MASHSDLHQHQPFSQTSPQRTRRLRIVSFSPTCWVKSQNYIAAFRFVRLLLDLCGQSKPTPENFFNAYISYQAEAGICVCQETIIKLMSKHAAWLSEEARRYVNVQSWKDFARTGDLDLDEDQDAEMDEIEISHPVGPTLSPEPSLALSPKRKRVGPLSRQ